MNKEIPRLELQKVLQHDAEEIISARNNALLIHSTRDISAAGDQVEQVVRNVIRRKLATKYYVGHGHILDSELTTSPQLDVIIADNSGAPILFKTENGTEYFPYESIYALGEIKSAYYKNKNYIHTFTDTLTQLKSTLKRNNTSSSYVSPELTFGPGFSFNSDRPYRNPLFSFMLFVHSNDFHIDHIRELYASRPHSELPNIICFLDKGIIANMEYTQNEDRSKSLGINLIPEFNSYSQKEGSSWVFVPWGAADNQLGANFGFLIFMLSSHLKKCVLMPPNLFAYLSHSFVVGEEGEIIA
jgi:hypothetical protein